MGTARRKKKKRRVMIKRMRSRLFFNRLLQSETWKGLYGAYS